MKDNQVVSFRTLLWAGITMLVFAAVLPSCGNIPSGQANAQSPHELLASDSDTLGQLLDWYYQTRQKNGAEWLENINNNGGLPSNAEALAKLRTIASLTRWVPLSTWVLAQDSFRYRFDSQYVGDTIRWWPRDTVLIKSVELLNTYDGHRSRVNGDWLTARSPGVLFHYGIDGDRKLVVGVEFLELKWEDGGKKMWKYTEGSGHFYKVTPDHRLADTSRTGWIAKYWQPYKNSVVVRGTDLKARGVDVTKDARLEVFHGDFLPLLSDANDKGDGYFMIVSASDPDIDPTMALTPHVLLIASADANKRALLDDNETTDGYIGGALELGSLCPPRCGKVPALDR